MAVDYTKVFTVLGKYVDKIIDYYAYIATFNTDRDSIETVLAAQSVLHVGDGLVDDFEGLKGDVSGWMQVFIDRMTTVLTDSELITSQFALGDGASLDGVLPVLLRDMFATDKNVVASVATIGSVTDVYRNNALSGKVVVGGTLDGVTPPMLGALPIIQYAGLTTQLTPDSETVTFTCVDDSEHGASRGSERFEVTGTGEKSDPYSTVGENLGSPGSVVVADNNAATYGNNLSFDNWAGTPSEPDNWSAAVGEGDTDYFEGDTASETLYGEGSSLKSNSSALDFSLVQVLDQNQFDRYKSYWLSFWTRKKTDAAGDGTFTVTIYHGAGTLLQLTGQPTSTSWVLYSGQFLIPDEITDDLTIEVASATHTADAYIIDQIVITPCEYMAGVSPAIFGGPEKFLIGDKFQCVISNNNAGKFQTAFRKSFKVQLPTDATPTISDALVT